MKMADTEQEQYATNCVKAYARLEDGAIDEIDAALFTGDIFMIQSNRDDFVRMMERWERQLKVWEDIEENMNEINIPT